MPLTAEAAAQLRVEREQQIYANAMTAVAQRAPRLTDNQRKQVATYIARLDPCYEGCREEAIWPVPSVDELLRQVDALEYLGKPDAECWRMPPTPGVLYEALAVNVADPRDRLSLHRELEKLTPDDLLARSKGVDLSASLKKRDGDTAKARDANAPKQPHEMTDAELYAYVREKHGDVLPSRAKAIADMLRARSRPQEMNAVASAKAKMAATGAKWLELPPIARLEAEREARAAGKTLQQLGIAV